MHIREAIFAYVAGLPDIEPIAGQMHENLRGTEYLDRDGQIGTILPIPIGVTETPESIEAGIRALNSNRLSQTVLAFSVNHVGECPDDSRLQEAAEVVRSATQDIPFASTLFTENYSTEDGTMGNIRARLLGAASLAMPRRDYSLSPFTTVITGDIDLLAAGAGLLPRLNGALQNGTAFAQAAVVQGYSRHLHATGLLPLAVSFPNMDKVLYFYNRAIGEIEYAAHGVWNAMLLGDYFGVGGYDTTKLHSEDFDLQERLFQYRGRSVTRRLPRATNAFAVVQQRRFYARLQSGHDILDSHNTDTDFSTVDDMCRGRPYEDFHDISLDESDVAIDAFWGLTRELDPLRTLGDSITWWRFLKILDSQLGRYPTTDWWKSPSRPEQLAYRDAQWQTRDLFKRVQFDYAASCGTDVDRHTL